MLRWVTGVLKSNSAPSAPTARRLLSEVLQVELDTEHPEDTPRRQGKESEADTILCKVLAYAALQKLSGPDLELLSESIGSAVLRDILDSETPGDVVGAALALLGSKVPGRRILEQLLRPGVEEALKHCVRTHLSALTCLPLVLLHAWIALGQGGILSSVHEFESMDAERIAGKQCEDRIIETWRVVAEMTESESDYICGEAFVMLQTLLHPKALQDFLRTSDSPFGPSLALENAEQRCAKLASRVLDQLLVRSQCLFHRAHLLWPGESLYYSFSRCVPSDRHVLPLTSLRNLYDNRRTVNERDIMLVGVPASHQNMRSEDDPTNTMGQSSTALAGGLGGPGELASVSQDCMFGEAAFVVVTRMIQLASNSFLKNPVPRPTRKLMGIELSRWSSIPLVSIESVPGCKEGGYHDVSMLELALEWLEQFLLPCIASTHNAFQLVTACRLALELCFTTLAPDMQSVGRAVCTTASESLLKVLRILRLHGTKTESSDSAKVKFFFETLEMVVEASNTAATKAFQLDPAKSAFFLSATLLETVSCAFVSATYASEDPIKVVTPNQTISGQGKSFVRLLYSIWTEIFCLDLDTDQVWSILSNESPGVLQEILKNQFDFREIRYALCYTLLETIKSLQNSGSNMDATGWITKALYTLEFTNVSLTWEDVSELFDVPSMYVDLTERLLFWVAKTAIGEEDPAMTRSKALLKRLVLSNLSFGNFQKKAKVRLLWVLAAHAKLLEEPDALQLLDALDSELFEEVESFKAGRLMDDLLTLFDCATTLVLSVPSLGDRVVAMFEGLTSQAVAISSSNILTEHLNSCVSRVSSALALSKLVVGLGLPPLREDIGAKPKQQRQTDGHDTMLFLNKNQVEIMTGVPASDYPCLPFYRQLLSGTADPVLVKVTVRPNPTYGTIMMSIWLENRVSNTSLSGLELLVETVGPLLVDSGKASKVFKGSLKPSQGVQLSLSLHVLSSGNLRNRFIVQNKGTQASLESAHDQDLMAAVMSSIEIAMKKSSGRSIKAIIRNANAIATKSSGSFAHSSSQKSPSMNMQRASFAASSVSSPAATPSTPSPSGKKRNSLGLRNSVKGIRRRSLISARSKFIRSSSASALSNPSAEHTAEDNHESDPVFTPGGVDLGFTEDNPVTAAALALNANDPAFVDYMEWMEETDLMQREICISLLLEGIKVSFPPLQLPLSLFLEPVSASSIETTKANAIRNRPNGWLDLETFRACWNSLKYARFTTTRHSSSSMIDVLASFESCLFNATRVSFAPIQSAGSCQAAWVCSTWSGNLLAFHVHLLQDGTDVLAEWKLRTDAATLWTSWSASEPAFQVFFRSIIAPPANFAFVN